MTRNLKLIVTGLFVCFVAAPVLAVAQDKEGCKDHPLISRYAGSTISRCISKQYDAYLLPLGKNARGNFAKSQHLEGKWTRITYDSPSGRSILEVFRNYEAALKRAGFETLWTCAGAEQCGTGDHQFNPAVQANFWGYVTGDRHLSAKLSRPDGDVYTYLWVWDRGTIVDVIEVKPMEAGLVTVDAAALAGDITRTGHAAVYGIYFDTGKADVKPESDAALAEIAKLLQQDPNLKLYVVGHTDNVGTLASNMDLSRRRANAVTQHLTTKYKVAATRLSAQGDGPTAPVASNATEEGRAKNRRVELVQQ